MLPFKETCRMIGIMKTVSLIIFMLFMATSAPIMPIVPAHAFLLDEAILSTYDKKCQIRYLTDKNTKGWYISVSPDSCSEGYLNGYADVTVYDAFSRPSEQIYGYWTDGYWTGETNLKKRFLKRSSEEYGVQKATFEVAKDKASDITYIGQMTARRNARDVYMPFEICDPFRILAVTPHTALFKNPHATQVILDDVVKQVREICPAEKRILFFSAQTDSPLPQDIVFYADINLETGKTYIKRNKALHPEATNPKKLAKPDRDDLAVAADLKGAVGSSVDVALRQEVSFGMSSNLENSVLDGASGPVVELPMQKDISSLDTLIDATAPQVEKTAETDQAVSAETSESTVSVSSTPANGMDTVAHLRLMSQVNQKPVFGTAVVHVDTLNEIEGIVDLPMPLTLTGKAFVAGWGVVSGFFDFDATGKGFVQVTSFLPCATHACRDIQ